MHSFRRATACILVVLALPFFWMAVEPMDPTGGDALDGANAGWIAAALAFAAYMIWPRSPSQ
ncbi:hypothetical protein AB0N99_30820 [Streptomyces sp. NPDC093272]|uniref:hypothetical protein n=1 Tax=Streptomyces sp. NPDC093272 TaxID=3154981 RepID=UPI0034344A65